MKYMIITLTMFLAGCMSTTDRMMEHNKLHCNSEGFESYHDLHDRTAFTCTSGQEYYIKR